MNLPKSIVLLSSGLDSTVNLFLARHQSEVIQTITFDYGQRALVKEIECAQKLSSELKIPHTVIDLPWLKNIGSSSLNNTQYKVPTGRDVSITDHQISTQTAKSVWVPNRNGVFLNIAACLAEASGAVQIIPGFNLEEASTFPDNSEAYMDAATEAFAYSTSNQVRVVSYTVKMQKSEIMKIALDQKVPLNKIWPCYFSFEKWCGECESCLRTKRAMIQNQIDPQDYFTGV